MDKLYMILLCLMIVPILICIKYSRKIKSDVASSIVKCLIFAIVTILSNGLSAFSGNETFSYIMEALYRFSFDLMLIYVLQYSQQYTRVFHEVSPFKKGCFIIAYLDGILLFLNIIFHNVFTIETVRFPNFDMYHVADKSIIFYFHYVFAYGLVVCIIASFIIKIIQIPDFYRKKYLPILVLVCVITVSKFICGISEFPIDVSLPFFVCAAILICYLTLYRSSRELVDKTLSIVVNEMNNAVICFDINNECVYANDHPVFIAQHATGCCCRGCFFKWHHIPAGRQLLDHVAAVHDDHLVGDVRDHAHVVGDDEHGGVELVTGEAQQVENFGLHGHVEGSGRLVGQNQAGVQHQRHGDDDALLLAAGELVRVVVHAGFGIRDADLLQDVDGLGAQFLLVLHAVGAQALFNLPADGVHRVQHRIGLLEHHRGLGTTHFAQLFAAQGEHVQRIGAIALGQVDGTGGGGRLRQQLDDGARGHGLAGTGFADHADHGLADLSYFRPDSTSSSVRERWHRFLRQ